MRLNLTIPAAVMGLCLSLLTSGKAIAETFSFTKIADTTPSTSSPTINDNGTVAFKTDKDLSLSIFTGDVGALTNIYTTTVGGTINIGPTGSPVINNTGTVAFDYILNYAGNGRYQNQTIFIAKDGNVSRIPYQTGGYSNGLGSPAINDSGTIAFKFDFQGYETIYASNGDPTVLASNFNRTTGQLSDPAISNVGTVAFSGLILDPSEHSIGPDSRTLNGVFTINISSGRNFTPIVLKDDTFAGFGNQPNDSGTVAINDPGTVAFVANLTTGGAGIFTKSSDGLLTRIADTSDAFKSFGNVAINNQGTVAFAARLNAGGQGIFTGADPVTNKVIATGDSLLGSTVTSLTFASRGLNNNQQIAFFATLANGDSGIFRAEQNSDQP